MNIQALTNQKGFSLVEALIAIVLLTVGLLSVGLLQIGAMKSNTAATNRSDGVAIAQSVMDTLRTLPMNAPLLEDNGSAIDDGSATGGNAPTPADADHTGTEIFGANPYIGMNGQAYTIFWNVADDTPINNTKTVRLFVYWNDNRFGLNRTIVTSVLGGLYLYDEN